MLEASRTPEPREDIVVTKFWRQGAIRTTVHRAFSRVSLTPEQRARLVGRYGAKVVRCVIKSWRREGFKRDGKPAFDEGVEKGGSHCSHVAAADVRCADPHPLAASARAARAGTRQAVPACVAAGWLRRLHPATLELAECTESSAAAPPAPPPGSRTPPTS